MNETSSKNDYVRGVRTVFVLSLIFISFAIFLVWKVDNPRAERLRMMVLEKIIPSFEWFILPIRSLTNTAGVIASFNSLSKENEELRFELRRLKNWKEAAIRLEEENAQLLELNNVSINPKLKYITGLVLSDSGSPYRRSVLLNIGTENGVKDGWAVIDHSGLIGRLVGVGKNLSRVLLLIDSSQSTTALY